MRSIFVLVGVIILTGTASAQEPHPKPADVNATIDRGLAFLIKAQRADGSWPMTSRPVKPGGEGVKSLIPITGAGSAWAVLGLVRSR